MYLMYNSHNIQMTWLYTLQISLMSTLNTRNRVYFYIELVVLCCWLKGSKRTGEMAHWGKCLLCKSEELSLDPQHPWICGAAQQRKCLSRLPVGILLGRFPGEWLMWEGSAHSHHPWAGTPALCKRANWANLCLSSCLQVPAQTSSHDGNSKWK